MVDHLDEQGAPCARHLAPEASLLALAALGSRTSAFHHDAATKLQSLMMALDELDELVDLTDSAVRLASETARTALRELHQLFAANRALARPPVAARTAVSELFARAAERVGVALRGERSGAEVTVPAPAITHALALVIDLCAGGASRAVEVATEAEGERVRLVLTGPAAANARPAQDAAVAVELAAFLLARGGGELRCGATDARFVIWLPSAPP